MSRCICQSNTECCQRSAHKVTVRRVITHPHALLSCTVFIYPNRRSSEGSELSLFLQHATESWHNSMRRVKNKNKAALEQVDQGEEIQRLVREEYEQHAATLQGKLDVAVATLGTTRDFLAWCVSSRGAYSTPALGVIGFNFSAVVSRGTSQPQVAQSRVKT